MAAKKTSGGSNESEQLVAAAEELRKAAEALMNKATESEPATPKKTTAKKSTPAKSSTAAKSTASKPKSSTAKPKAEPKAEAKEEPKTKSAAKPKSTAKKATKAEPAPEAKEEPVTEPKTEEPKVEEPVEAPKAEEPKEEPKAEEPVVEEPKEEPKTEEPVAEEPKEEPKAEEPVVEEPKEEPKAEKVYCPHCGAENTAGFKFCMKCGTPLDGSYKAEQPPKTEPKAEAAAASEPAEKPQKKMDMNEVATKTEDFITNKGKLPIFIVVNALFLVCSIFLMSISVGIPTTGKTAYYSLFSYLGGASEIKALFAKIAFDWTDGAYGMIGFLMVLSMLVPLALIVKNLILLFAKKNKNVYKYDAVIVFAFLLFYIAMINFYGAIPAAGPVISFTIAAINLVFTIFADLLVHRKDDPETPFIKKLPIFSIAVIVLAVLCVMIFTGTPIYVKGKSEYYGVGAAHANTAGGFMFITYLVTVLALIALVVVQLWKLPSIIDIILPAASAVCALLTLIVPAAGVPAGYKAGGGFVFGIILTVILAAAYLIFTLIPPLKKLKVQLNTQKPVHAAATNVGAVDTVETNPEEPQETKKEEAPKAEEPKEEVVEDGKITCPKCGAKVDAGSMFCNVCGNKLK